MDDKTTLLIQKIADEHARSAHKKNFGYFEKNDLVNEVWVLCLEKIKEFDPAEGQLENFLRVIVKNGLTNKWKAVSKISKPPCSRCEFWLGPHKKPDCMAFGLEKEKCGKYHNYILSKDSKNSLLGGAEMMNERLMEKDILGQIAGEELVELIRGKIELKYKKDFEKFIQHENLTENKIKRLSKIVKTAINEMHLEKYREKNNLTILTIEGKNADYKKG